MKPVEDQPIRLTHGKVYRWPDDMPPGWNTPGGTVPLIEAERFDRVLQSYEQKVDDLRRETLRSSTLSALSRRLFDLLMGAARDGRWSEQELRALFDGGFPPDEKDALVSVLRGHDKPESARFVLGGNGG